MSSVINKTDYHHITVLKEEAIESLAIKPNGTYLDATFGGGGHTEKILSLHPTVRVVAFDLDREAIKHNYPRLQEKYGDRVTVIWGNFAHCYRLLRKAKITQIDGVLADFGTSQHQIHHEDGFSFQKNTPLDMRMSKSHQYFSAEHVVNKFTAKQLATIFYQFGEETQSYKIANAIIREREIKKITTTQQLVHIIEKVKPRLRHHRIHPATKVFQALRIFVNKELDSIQLFLKNIISFLSPGARLACISFHSLEDRIVKQFFVEHDQLNVLTRKPIVPSEEEISRNKASRSAKLRIAEKKR